MSDLYVPYNPNPNQNSGIDCAVRAICKALGQDWDTTYTGLCACGFEIKRMPSDDYVWGRYLRRKGYRPMFVDAEKEDYTVVDFCLDNPKGTYVLKLPGHLLCVKDGHYFDTFDSGVELPIFCWVCPSCKKEE